MSFSEQIRKVAASYDRTIEFGMRAVDLYENLPAAITSHPAYSDFREATGCGSDSAAVRRFLDPQAGMRFLDLGCAANIINYRTHEWPAEYFGVDSSEETVKLLRRHVRGNGISVGGIVKGMIDRLPFEDGFFQIAACIGVLEYYPIAYARESLPEIRRVMAAGGRLYVDVPNIDHPACEVMCMVEEHMGRPILLKEKREELDRLMTRLFEVSLTDASRVMSGYYLTKAG